jgi:hypothetical protein
VRLPNRAGQDAVAVGGEVITVEAELAPRQRCNEGGEVFVGELVPASEIHTERAVFAFEIAGADAEGDTAAGEAIQRSHGAGDEKRVAVRQHQDPGLQAQRACGGTEQGEHHERVLGVVSACIEPARGGAGMVRHQSCVKACGVECLSDLGDGVGGQELLGCFDVVERQRHVDIDVGHVATPSVCW